MDENAIDEVLKASLRGERPYVAFLKLAGSRRDLPKPLAELRKALVKVEDEVERDAAVAAALVLYKTLVKNAEAYKEWAELYHWAGGLVKEREFTIKAEEVKRLREAQRRLEEAAEEVRRELNSVLTLYSQSGFYKEADLKKLKSLLEVNLGEAEELENMGLVEGDHFTVKTPKGGKKGYVSILREGLAYAAWLSVHGSGERQRLAAEFVYYILQRAREAGEEVYEKAKEIVEEGRARGSLTLEGFERRSR